jgi:hypothetical protein
VMLRVFGKSLAFLQPYWVVAAAVSEQQVFGLRPCSFVVLCTR